MRSGYIWGIGGGKSGIIYIIQNMSDSNLMDFDQSGNLDGLMEFMKRNQDLTL